MTSIEDYQYLWDGSSPEWCLLETKSWVEGKRRFEVFNFQNPTEIPLIYWRTDEVKDKMLSAKVRVIPLDEKLADPIRDYCRHQGWSIQTICGTFDKLISRWESLVKAVVRGTYVGLDDYLNDLMHREHLEELIDFAGDATPISIRERMLQLDVEMKSVLRPSLVGSIWAAEWTNEKYSREKHWYYFMVPVYVGELWEEYVRQDRKPRKSRLSEV